MQHNTKALKRMHLFLAWDLLLCIKGAAGTRHNALEQTSVFPLGRDPEEVQHNTEALKRGACSTRSLWIRLRLRLGLIIHTQTEVTNASRRYPEAVQHYMEVLEPGPPAGNLLSCAKLAAAKQRLEFDRCVPAASGTRRRCSTTRRR